MDFHGQAILLDIEGTTSSVSFVHDVMFPYVRRELATFLESHWQHVDVQLACDQIARDAGHASLEAWCGASRLDQLEQVQAEVLRQMDSDEKATGLKQLQGLIWRDGFESGEMKAHVYPEVPACIRAWKETGRDVRIYSSGSVQAQQLFFGHTQVGNLLPLFTDHYDTTIGGKKEAASYRKIATAWQLQESQILFLSDLVAELDAAQQAGMHTALCLRPGNAAVAPGHQHATVSDFHQVQLV